jgi:ATP synthase protein I
MAEQKKPNPLDSSSGRDKAPPGNAWIGLSSVGFEFVFSVLVPGALGWWLDRKFGTGPWLMLVGGIFGFGAGFYRLMKTVTDANRRK